MNPTQPPEGEVQPERHAGDCLRCETKGYEWATFRLFEFPRGESSCRVRQSTRCLQLSRSDHR